MVQRKAIFIAATGQNVGKTTVCLGLIALLKKTYSRLGFIKPVGQQHKKVGEELLVDKDVILFKEYFQLPSDYADLSPVIFPSGFTRSYLDGKIETSALREKILKSYHKIAAQSDFTIVEGTGHVGVGSITDLNNAQVAKLLGLDILLIAKGGIGSCFDEIALNKALCDSVGVKIRGIILNKVHEEKRGMISSYVKKALLRWDIPLLGAIPYLPFLSNPAMEDFELLFDTKLFSGEKYHYCHFENMRLVATSLETFRSTMISNQLIVTPATREDIVGVVIAKRDLTKEAEYGLILTGRIPPSPTLIERLKRAEIPALYAAKSSFEAMRLITSFHAKIHGDDTLKVEKAIQVVGKYVEIKELYS